MKKILLHKSVVALLLLFVCFKPVYAALAVGDIAFVGFNADGNDDVAFVALTNIAAGEVIIFEDNEWNGSAWVDANENAFIWTAPAGGVSAGTIVQISSVNTGSPTTNLGTVAFGATATYGNNRGISGGDEVIYAYQGTRASPSFITAVANGGYVAANGTLPASLTLGTNAINLAALDDDLDIASFTGLRNNQATFGAYRSIINTPSNWNFQDGSGDQSTDVTAPDVPFSMTAFTISATPTLSINDVLLNEGNMGTTTFTFTVSLSAPAGAGGVTFDIATADDTAQDDNPSSEDNDYVAKSLSGQTIPAGGSTYTFDVSIIGDVSIESNEPFFVNVTNVSGATTSDGQGQGTILNDDAVNTLPTIALDVTTTTNFLDGGVAIAPASPYAVSGVISDPTDPGATLGIDFTIGDVETAAAILTLTAFSSNTSVVPNNVANLVLSGAGANRKLKIVPVGIGYATITVTVTDGGSATNSYTIEYAASAASTTTSTSRFHTGASDASTAVAIDADYMLVADDEDQTIRLYDRTDSGLPLAAFTFTSSLGLTDISGGGIPREVDIEASTKVGSTIYWLASHGNSSSGNDRPNRERIFSTTVGGSGAATTLTFGGYYRFLEDDLLAWDNANGHGLGAGFLGLQASAAVSVVPEAVGGVGFNIEGLTFAADNTTAYIAFRAPIEPTSARTKALIIPVTNFTTILNEMGGASGSATFGAPIFLDLGGRGIRSIEKNSNNEYLIIAGPATGTGDFKFYTWTGVATDAPIERAGDLSFVYSESAFESILEVPNPLTAASSIQVLMDNGDRIWYNDATISKALPRVNWEKFRSDLVTLGATVIPTVEFTATDNGASETGPDAGTFRITRTGATTSMLTVNYTISGTAVGADYTPTLTGTAMFNNGESSIDIIVTPVDDNLVEGNETLILTLTDAAPYDLGASAAATVTIIDNEAAVPVPTTTTISSNLNPSFTGNNVTFTATVTSGGNPVTLGTVTFTEGATILAANVNLNGSGQAGFSISTLTEGSHNITATYNGTSSFLTSNGSGTQTVNNVTVVNGNSFCNVGVITLNDGNPGGITGTPATPYPSNIFVSGLVGTIQSITVDLNGLTHNRASDIDLLLVAPTGGKFLMMTGVGQFSLYSNTNLTLSDAAASALPQVGAIPSGTYRPASYELTNIFPAPAPASPYNQPATQGAATFASVFNGLDPNGTWSLYATDDTTNIIGSISKGWCLNINTPPPCTPPDISDEPDAVIVCAGSATSFTVAASGSGTLSYQWQEDGIDLTNTGVYSNVTTATLNISDVTGLNGKQYQVIITNDNGTSDDASDDCSSTSEEVMLTVFDPQAGTLSATNPVICAGETTTLNFTPTAGLTVVGWFLDDAAAGCNPTGSSLSTGTTFNVSPIGTTSYAVVVQNSDGCRDTACVTINVNPKPNITASATQTTICAGETTTLNFTPTTDVAVVGWFLDDDDAGCNPMGGSLSTGTTFDVSPSVTTTYAVVVETDSGCRDTACVTINVNPKPDITASATNTTICAGETTTLNFTPTAGLTVVGWFLDDAAAGCNPTGSSLSTGTTFNVSPIGTTSYAVVVQNSDGCRDTACVTINVNPKPNITASATQTTICAGETTTLNFTPTTDLTVVGWFLDDDDAGCNPMGASLSTGTTFDVSPGVTTTYAVVVETDSGCRDTACVTITVNPLPTITLGANPVVCAGETSANLAFTATTGSPNQYSIDFADNSFADVTNGVLGSSPIVIAVPANAAVGTYNATLTVRNSTTTCGSQTYNISVRVLNCNIVVSDPCSCKNNATTLVNGQFNETVTIIAPSGQTWTVSAVNNLYQTTSPAPPAAPTLIAIGTAFTETPNGDGTSTYTLAGLTVDATSYSLSATNGIGTILSINNICYYPNPAITGLDPAYCADEPAVTLTGTIDRGDGQTAITPQSAVFDINGTVATQFDPQALGAGTYNVGFTVDAAAEGVTFPGCVQAVSQVVRVDPQVTVDAGTPQTICRTKTLALSALNPSVQYSGTVADLIYTWSFVEAGNNGTLTGTSSTDLNAGTYTPGPDAIVRGYVTLRLTVDNPNDACEPVSDTVRVNILNVDCGKFPWNGN